MGDVELGDRILADFTLSGTPTRRKWRDRLPCLDSTIPKSFSFSESDRRGI
ncbi:hypothetical protein PJF56_08930 [Roseofilum sp. BLCC_M91]|uniref:Uncharacterized protein n=1 Tax=Roseofilum halophilum BLCC-M91 TaxID=3022259 RepID=A0ABT7BKH1_9CYAN|nr:hypothetical protein [Roseofilum halophilum]MDJ1178986.1 hypothetical protein [Roseofilum halophilum BLCC-M91]